MKIETNGRPQKVMYRKATEVHERLRNQKQRMTKKGYMTKNNAKPRKVT